MNMKKEFYIAALSLLTLAGCSNDNNEPAAEQKSPAVIRLSSSVADVDVATRASSTLQATKLDEGLEVGVFILDNLATANAYSTGYDKTNHMFTAGADSKLNPTQGRLYYFPADGNAANIFAYAPCLTSWSLTGTNTFEVQTNQTDSAHYVASDLMYGTPTAGNPVAPTEDVIGMTFNHCLAKVIVNFVTGPGMDENDLMSTVNGVYLTSLSRTATITMTNRVVSNVTASGAQTDQVQAGTAAETCACILVPQTIQAGNTVLHITTSNGGTFDWEPTADFVLQSGKVYTITATLSLKKITVTTTVNNWIAGNSYTPAIEK